ncbi:MAG: hypothetical protein Q4B28_07575 [bacterium]|nr:hypothetical protein [bacterium]
MDISDLQNGEYTTWRPELQLGIDAVLTKNVLQRSKERITQLKNMISGMESLFNQTLAPLSAVFKTYPFDAKLLEQEYPELWKELTEIRERVTPETSEEEIDRIKSEMYQKETEIYLHHLQNKNPPLAQVMEKLIANKFDFMKLEEKEVEDLVAFLTEQRLEEMKKSDLIKIFEPDRPHQFETFFRSLFDFRQNTLDIGGQSLKITKALTP